MTSVHSARSVGTQRAVQQSVKAALGTVTQHRCKLPSQPGGRMTHHVGDERLRMRSP